MNGLMMNTPLLVTEIMRYADRISRAARSYRSRWTLRGIAAPTARCSGVPQARQCAARPRREAKATGSPRWPGTISATSSSITRSRAWAPCCTRSIRGCFPSRSNYIVNHAEDRCCSSTRRCLPLLAQLARQAADGPRKTIVLTSDAAMPAAVAGKLESLRGVHRRPAGRHTTGRCSTSAPPPRSATPRARPATRRACCYSHRSTVLHAYAGCAAGRARPVGRETRPAVVPMFHANAWGLPYNGADGGREARVPGPEDGRSRDAGRR